MGRSLCHTLYNPLRRSRPEKNVCQGRAEAKAAPGKCFMDWAAPCGLHSLEPSGRTSPSQSIHARKPCPNQTLIGRGGDGPGQGLFPTEAAAPTGSRGMLSNVLAGKRYLLWSSREMPSPRPVWHASTTASFLEEENGLTNLWSLSLTSAADTAGGTCKPSSFIYLSVLILA